MPTPLVCNKAKVADCTRARGKLNAKLAKGQKRKKSGKAPAPKPSKPSRRKSSTPKSASRRKSAAKMAGAGAAAGAAVGSLVTYGVMSRQIKALLDENTRLTGISVSRVSRDKIKELEAENARLQADEEHMVELEAENARLEASIRELTRERNNLQNQLDAKPGSAPIERELDLVDDEIEALRDQQHECAEERHALEQQQQACEASRETLEQEIARLERISKNCSEHDTGLAEENHRINALVSTLESQNSELYAALKEENRRAEALQAELAEMGGAHGALETVKEEKAAIGAEIKELARKKTKLQREIDVDVAETARAADEQKSAIQAEITALNAERTELSRAVERLRDEVHEINAEIEAARSRHRTTMAQIWRENNAALRGEDPEDAGLFSGISNWFGSNNYSRKIEEI